MKKIISSIFIFTILTGLFAPFSYDLKKDEFIESKANADSIALKQGPYSTKADCQNALSKAKTNNPGANIADGCASSKTFTITQDTTKSQQASTGEIADVMPGCAFIFGKGSFMGCLVQAFYYIFFVPTSALFGLAGKFFDFTFVYSVSDDSYRTAFVTEGWGIVRDFCNVFFIFILMYAAFKMILNIGHGEKGTIIAVIIIGLLINFSLFTTRVIIDSSNILARVFYNYKGADGTDIVNIQGDKATRGGVDIDKPIAGEKALSAALVNQVDPQRIIFESKSFKLESGGESGSSTDGQSGNSQIGVGAFFLITFLAVIINIIGTFVFLSVGLIFVARVIGLWFSMIFVPFAFLSYTIPSLQGVKMIGWKNWWSDTLGMCFLAPIFMFFLFLILKFLKKGFLGIADTDLLGLIIPFVFIMVMLLMAKKLAKDYSGSIGQSITGAVAAAGGLALGGAALGAAFVGRTAISKPLKKIANSEGAMRHAENMKAWEDGGRVGPKPQASFMAKWGYRMNKREEDQGHILHTRHELDDIAKKEFNGQTYGELSTAQKNKVKEALTKEKAEKKHNALARSTHNKDYKDLSDDEKRAIRTEALRQAKDQVEHSADRKINLRDSLLTSMRKGSYDVRNISDININKMDSWQNKLSSSIVKAISGGMRGGLKNMADINYGKGQKDFFKDLGHTITEAIKSAKFVSIPTGGGGGGHDHGGGHDDHGGGHH